MPCFVSIDVETANSNPYSICQIGMARFEHGKLINTYSQIIDPDCHFLDMNMKIHGIRPEHVKGMPKFDNVYDIIHEWLSQGIVTSHSYFDRGAIHNTIKHNLLPEPSYRWLDATTIIRRTWAQFRQRGYGLSSLSKHFELEFKHHDALEDARISGEILCMAIKDSGKSLEEWAKELKK